MKFKYTLSETLLNLYAIAQTKPLSIKEILEILAGRGSCLSLIFLSLPFCQPLQIPGLSTPFGLLITYLGLRMSIKKEISLPKFLLSKVISKEKIQKIIKIFLKIFNKLKFLIHPRLIGICQHPKMHVIHGLFICVLGILLALPLPIPLSNLIFAWSIFFIALGILENDGLCVLIGYSIMGITISILLALFWASAGI